MCVSRDGPSKGEEITQRSRSEGRKDRRRNSAAQYIALLKDCSLPTLCPLLLPPCRHPSTNWTGAPARRSSSDAASFPVFEIRISIRNPSRRAVAGGPRLFILSQEVRNAPRSAARPMSPLAVCEQAGRMGRVRLPAVCGAASRVEQTDLERCEGRIPVETECLEGRNIALELVVCWVGHASVWVVCVERDGFHRQARAPHQESEAIKERLDRIKI